MHAQDVLWDVFRLVIEPGGAAAITTVAHASTGIMEATWRIRRRSIKDPKASAKLFFDRFGVVTGFPRDLTVRFY